MMDMKCNDAIFGEMTYKHRWVKSEQENFFGKDYILQIAAKAYSGKPITEEQRETYKKYLDEKEWVKGILADQLINYINENVQELAEYWIGARKIDKVEDLSNVVEPRTLLIKQDGTMLFLLECAWDIENGVAVEIYPEVVVVSQDLFL